MLNIQRWKTYTHDDLRAEGLSEKEISAIENREIGPFRPAYVNGKRRSVRESEEQNFYERMQRHQMDLQVSRSGS
jgi:hypothetical protein